MVACETGLSFDEAKQFVSIVADEAKDRPGWHMPYTAMYDVLKALTGERILRGDMPIPAGKAFADGTAFESRVRTSAQAGDRADLWLEYDVC